MNETFEKFIEKYGISGSAIKLIAMITMFIDHAGIILFRGTEYYTGLRIVGRLAFPLFAFLVSEGIAHSKNLGKYALRLLLFALASEIPFNMAQRNALIVTGSCNIFFTYFIPVFFVYLTKQAEKYRYKYVIDALLAAAAFAGAYFMNPDYDWRGVMLVLLFYYLRKYRLLQLAVCAVYMFIVWNGMQLYALISLALLLVYNGSRGLINTNFAKYSIYAFYPAHLLWLYLIKLIIY